MDLRVSCPVQFLRIPVQPNLRIVDGTGNELPYYKPGYPQIGEIVKLFCRHCVYTILVISSYLQEVFGLSEISLTDNRKDFSKNPL